MAKLIKPPAMDLQPMQAPKELEATIKQMKKAKLDTKELEDAKKKFDKASGKLAAVTKKSQVVMGKEYGLLADVCKTPGSAPGPTPIPYPNVVKSQKATDAETKKLKKAEAEHKKASDHLVKVLDKQAIQLRSQLKRSAGDQQGMLKGVVTNMTQAKVKVVAGTSKVKIEGENVVRALQMNRKTGEKQLKAIEKQQKSR